MDSEQVRRFKKAFDEQSGKVCKQYPNFGFSYRADLTSEDVEALSLFASTAKSKQPFSVGIYPDKFLGDFHIIAMWSDDQGSADKLVRLDADSERQRQDHFQIQVLLDAEAAEAEAAEAEAEVEAEKANAWFAQLITAKPTAHELRTKAWTFLNEARALSQ
jgi:hypothetical protein